MRFVENEKVELKEIYIPEIKKEVIAFANSFEAMRALEQELHVDACDILLRRCACLCIARNI